MPYVTISYRAFFAPSNPEPSSTGLVRVDTFPGERARFVIYEDLTEDGSSLTLDLGPNVVPTNGKYIFGHENNVERSALVLRGMHHSPTSSISFPSLSERFLFSLIACTLSNSSPYIFRTHSDLCLNDLPNDLHSWYHFGLTSNLFAFSVFFISSYQDSHLFIVLLPSFMSLFPWSYMR